MPTESRKTSQGTSVSGMGLKGKIGVCLVDKGRAAHGKGGRNLRQRQRCMGVGRAWTGTRFIGSGSLLCRWEEARESFWQEGDMIKHSF